VGTWEEPRERNSRRAAAAAEVQEALSVEVGFRNVRQGVAAQLGEVRRLLGPPDGVAEHCRPAQLEDRLDQLERAGSLELPLRYVRRRIEQLDGDPLEARSELLDDDASLRMIQRRRCIHPAGISRVRSRKAFGRDPGVGRAWRCLV
jgi:hypothetical protein